MSDENPTLGPLGSYLGVSKSSGALVGLTACNSQVKVMKTGPVSSGLVATYGKRVTLFTHKGGDVNVVTDWSLPVAVTRSNTFCTPCILLPGEGGADGPIALCAVQTKSSKSRRQAKIRLVYWKGNEGGLREATYIDTPDDFEMSGGRCALHAVGSSDCLLVSAAGQVLLYSSIQRTRSQKAENAEALLQLLHRVPSLHLPEGFEIVWTFLSGGGSSNLASSTALLTIGKDPGGRGHLVLYTVSSVSGAVVPLKIHLLSHPNPISAAYQESESMLLVASRGYTDKSPDRICGYVLRLGGSSLIPVFTTELNNGSSRIPGRIVSMAGLPYSKSLMVLDDTPCIRFYSTRYGANLDVTVSIPDSMKEGIPGAFAAVFPDGSALVVISSIGSLVCHLPGYLVDVQLYHPGSLASLVGSRKRQGEEEDSEEKAEQPTPFCVDFRCYDQSSLKDALTSAGEGEIPKACNDWPMIPGAVREGNIRDTVLAIRKASKAKGQGKKPSPSERMSAALSSHTAALIQMANEGNLRLPSKRRKPVFKDKQIYQQVAHEAIAAVMTRPSDQALWNIVISTVQCGKISTVMLPGLVCLASDFHMWTALEHIFAYVVDISERDIVWALRMAMRELSKENGGGVGMHRTRSKTTSTNEMTKANGDVAESRAAINSLRGLMYAALRSPYNEAFLREAVSDVSAPEALLMLQILCCLLREGNFRETVPLNCSKKRFKIHKAEQPPSKSTAVGWIAALLEAHFIGFSHSKFHGTIVERLLCEARAEILECEVMLTMKGLIDGLRNLQRTGRLPRPPAFSYETLRF